MEADGLSDAEKIAIRYGELFATNHLAIDDAFYDKLREHFTEPQIVELGLNVAMCVGVGRLSATWDMVEELPDRFRADGEVTPWGDDAIIVR
jgi:alkylhydroperoxidase family enzyme